MNDPAHSQIQGDPSPIVAPTPEDPAELEAEDEDEDATVPWTVPSD